MSRRYTRASSHHGGHRACVCARAGGLHVKHRIRARCVLTLVCGSIGSAARRPDDAAGQGRGSARVDQESTLRAGQLLHLIRKSNEGSHRSLPRPFAHPACTLHLAATTLRAHIPPFELQCRFIERVGAGKRISVRVKPLDRASKRVVVHSGKDRGWRADSRLWTLRSRGHPRRGVPIQGAPLVMKRLPFGAPVLALAVQVLWEDTCACIVT